MTESAADAEMDNRASRNGVTGLMGSLSIRPRGARGGGKLRAPEQPGREPLSINDGRDKLFVEAAYRVGKKLLIVGWSTDLGLEFFSAPGRAIDARCRFRHRRKDVAQSLDLRSARDLGFLLELDNRKDPRALLFRGSAEPEPVAWFLPLRERIEPSHWRIVGESVYELLTKERPGSKAWHETRALIPAVPAETGKAAGFIEGVMIAPFDGGGVAYGWALEEPGKAFWLEAGEGWVIGLGETFRQPRRDVRALFPGRAPPNSDAGFIAFLPDLDEESTVRLCCVTADGQSVVSELGRTHALPDDPLGAAQQLFGVETPETLMGARYARIDSKVLSPLVQRRVEQFRATPEIRQDFGTSVASPDVSIIVPLYGRYDFLEHQVMEFCRDPYVRSRCQVIYSIDQPEIVDGVIAEGRKISRLFDFPLNFVWTGMNFGYSAANNLGARIATGHNLLFLNSDAIPTDPGWLEQMVETLEAHEATGAVGAQLLFPTGGIQHAGMRFEYIDRFRVWMNEHPHSGLASDLVAEAGPRVVPGVTGACLLLSRQDFDAVGGWDMGYIVGDFEDSDLCLSLRARKRLCLYEPRARLVHLERQSFSGLGLGSFRLRLTLANAQRHTERWASVLANTSEETA